MNDHVELEQEQYLSSNFIKSLPDALHPYIRKLGNRDK